MSDFTPIPAGLGQRPIGWLTPEEKTIQAGAARYAVAPPHADAQPPPASILPDGLRVLLVEDDPALRRSLSEALAEAGFRVTAAENAEQVLALSGGAIPDVLVSDINLGPGLDGIALAAEAWRRWPLVRVILMSGIFANLMRQHLCPANRFLLKPFRPEALVRLIAELNSEPAELVAATN